MGFEALTIFGLMKKMNCSNRENGATKFIMAVLRAFIYFIFLANISKSVMN